MSDEPVLQISDLNKSYQSGTETLHVIRDLELSVRPGTSLAVTGESGSGKSTFLHLVGGMEKPDQGSIVFQGKDISILEGEELAHFRNLKIGFIFQFHHLLPEFTALENVIFPLLLRRKPFSEASSRGRGLLEDVGLADRAHHKPGELSGGEQQRVAIARALAGQPELLLGDEPTGNLDEKTSAAIHRLLMDIHKRYQLTSIIVTHNPALAGLCDQQKHMERGHLQ